MDKNRRIKQILFIVSGILCVGIGTIAIVVPVLPTTPFLLLASFLFLNSSEKLNEKLLNSKVLGEYIKNYKTYHAMKRNTKIFSIIFLWITLFISGYLVDILLVRIILAVVGIAVSTHILTIKTLENIKTEIE